MLVDENSGTSDSLATSKSPNHTKSSENTGRWRLRNPAASPRARNKRSLEPLDLLDGGGVSVGRTGDGTTTVHDDPPENRFVSRTLNARTNNALPQQMYVAMMEMASKRQSSTSASAALRRHRKRQAAADVVVYRKESDDGGGYSEIVDKAVNIVPLDSEHRIRVNLTIASDDSAGSPMYSVSLSLPSVEQQPKPEKVHSDISTDTGGMVQQPSLSAGTECECFCPCLEQDDDDNDHQTSKARLFSTTPSTIIPIDNEKSSSTFWITSSTTSGPSSETSPSLEPLQVSCPPVFLFCDSGKRPPVYILGYTTTTTTMTTNDRLNGP